MENRNAWALVLAGFLLAAGMSAAAFILGGKFKTLGDNRQHIAVKGLAEKPVQADLAEWTVGLEVKEAGFAGTLEKLRASRPMLDEFLAQQGFPAASLEIGNEQVGPNMVTEYTEHGMRSVQQGYMGHQYIRVRSKELERITQAHKVAIQLTADGKPVIYDAPLYLVSDLESIKMSLIGAATRNARQRADEFAKVGNVQVGAMRSASQGAFYILPANAESDAGDYGGVYDKSTIAKKARVVVTIDYGIE
ncbi:SIMPL domain-containing protein [Betaproteobacteria bacterium]|nr:SIMPL domain-containing protein [Betaproteobacteria bacterium]